MLKTEEKKTRYEHGDIIIVVIEKIDTAYAKGSAPLVVKEVQLYQKGQPSGNTWRENPTGIAELVKALIALSETHPDLFPRPFVVPTGVIPAQPSCDCGRPHQDFCRGDITP